MMVHPFFAAEVFSVGAEDRGIDAEDGVGLFVPQLGERADVKVGQLPAHLVGQLAHVVVKVSSITEAQVVIRDKLVDAVDVERNAAR